MVVGLVIPFPVIVWPTTSLPAVTAVTVSTELAIVPVTVVAGVLIVYVVADVTVAMVVPRVTPVPEITCPTARVPVTVVDATVPELLRVYRPMPPALSPASRGVSCARIVGNPVTFSVCPTVKVPLVTAVTVKVVNDWLAVTTGMDGIADVVRTLVAIEPVNVAVAAALTVTGSLNLTKTGTA